MKRESKQKDLQIAFIVGEKYAYMFNLIPSIMLALKLNKYK